MVPIGVESRRGQDESTIDDISRTHTSSVKQRLLFMFPFNRCFWLPGWEWEVSTHLRHSGLPHDRLVPRQLETVGITH